MPKYNTKEEALAATTPETIIKAYTGGRLEYTDFNKLMVEKAMFENRKAFGDSGYLVALYRSIIKELNKGWENINEAAKEGAEIDKARLKGESTFEDMSAYVQLKNEMMRTGQALWGMAQIANAIPTALGEVNGLVAERVALNMGASPSTAAHLRVAADFTTNIIPSVGAAKLSATVIKGGAQAIRGMVKKEGLQFGEGAARHTPGLIPAKDIGVESSGQMVLPKGPKGAPLYEGLVPPKQPLRNRATYEAPIQQSPQTIEDASKAGQLILPDTPDPGVVTKGGQTGLALKAGKEGPGTGVAVPPEQQAATRALEEGLAAGGHDPKIVTEGARVGKAAAPTPKAKYIETETGTVIDTETGELVPTSLVTPAMRQSGEAVSAKAVAPRVWTGVAQKVAKDLGIPEDDFAHLMAGWVPHKVAAGDPDGAAREFVEQIAHLTPQQTVGMRVNIQRIVRDQRGSFTPESLGIMYSDAATTYRNILLANPGGRIRDLLTNVGATANYMTQRQVGAMIGGEVTTGGTVAYARGLVAAIDDGFVAFKRAFTPEGLKEGSSRFDKPIEEVASRMFINTPTSFTVGIDRFFKTINRRAYLYAAEAERAAKTGTKFDMANVDMPGGELLRAAEQHADYVTFQNDLGKLGTWVSGLARMPVTELYFPFMKTPLNLLKYGWENTPGLQLTSTRLWGELAAGGPAADAAMGRLVMSNMFGFYVSELSKAGLITGSGPAHGEARASWLKTHRPYSIKIGEEWYGLDFASPLHQIVGNIANMTQIMPDFEANPAALGKMSMAIMMSTYEVMKDDSWMRQVNELNDGIKGVFAANRLSDTQFLRGMKVLAQPAISVFTSGPVAMAKNLYDPVQRDAATVIEHFQAATPIYSTTVPPKTDAWGNDIIPDRALGGPLGGPKMRKIPTDDPVVMEGSRLGVQGPSFSRSIGGSPHEFDLDDPQEGDHVGVGLSLQQEYERKKLYREYLYNEEVGVPMIVKNSEYTSGPDLKQKKMYEGVMREAKKNADEKMLVKYPELGIQLLQNQARQVLGQFQPNDPARYDIQRGFAEGISFYENLTPDEQANILRFTTPED